MSQTRIHSSKPKRHNKKEKKLIKLIKNDSETDGDESEHELSFYMKDRVKLMKEVLKIIKPKKIRSMAPDCMRGLDNEEINSRLLEELLGISDKRLKYIFTGQNLNEDSSSTDPEAEDEPIDLISLDDISDGDLVIDLDSDVEVKKHHCKKHRNRIKEEQKEKKVKKEKCKRHKVDKNSHHPNSNKTSEENLMSVLELLELQARARAIKSQLVLEKQQDQEKQKTDTASKDESDNDNDAVIVEIPRNEEIIISSSDSENDQQQNITENQAEIIEEPTDFWCGTKDKEINECEKDQQHIIQSETTKKVDNIEVVQKDTTTTEDISDSQSVSDFNKKSELVDVMDIPLPISEQSVNVESNNSIEKRHTTRKYRKKSKPYGSDISEGEIGSTDDEISEAKNLTAEETRKTSLDSSKETEIVNKEEVTIQQVEESIIPEDVHKPSENSKGNFKEITETSDRSDEDLVENNPSMEVEVSDEENSTKKDSGNVEIPKSGPRKSKRASSKVQMDISSSADVDSSARKKLVRNKVAKLSEGYHGKKVEIEKGNSSDDGERIVLNVEQSELDSVNLD